MLSALDRTPLPTSAPVELSAEDSVAQLLPVPARVAETESVVEVVADRTPDPVIGAVAVSCALQEAPNTPPPESPDWIVMDCVVLRVPPPDSGAVTLVS